MPTVLVTRAAHQAEPLKSRLEALGFQPLLQPAVEFRPPDSWNDVDAAIRQLFHSEKQTGFDWIVFSSANGVHFFFDRYRQLIEEGIVPEELPPVRFAVTGTGTNEALYSRCRRRADVMPEIFCSEEVAEKLADEAKQGKRFLICRASRGRDILKQKIQSAGGNVTEAVLYQSVDAGTANPEIAVSVQQGQVDYAVVMSPAVAGALIKMFGSDLHRVKFVSISPLTSAALHGLGFPPQYEAKEASIEGIIRVFEEASRITNV